MESDDQSEFSEAFSELSELTSEASSSNASAEAGACSKSGLRNRRKCKELVTLTTHEKGSGLGHEEAISEDDLKAELSGCTEILSDEESGNPKPERCAEILSEEDEVESFASEEIKDARSTQEPEKPQRREVYKMPESNPGTQDSFIFWPANFIILAVAWQLRLIFCICSALVSLSTFLYGLLVDPVQKTAEVKKQVSEQLNSQLKPVVTDLGPRVTSIVKRLGWGILAVTYVGIVLSLLLVPVLLTEYLVITKLIEKPLHITTPLHFNYTEAHPSATVPLAPRLTTPGGAKPFSWYKLLADVTLTLPESDYNRNLGMFQVAAEVLSVSDEILDVSSRPCMLRFQSPPIRYARTLIYGVPVLLDVTGEFQQLHLSLIELAQEASMDIGRIRVIIQPRAGFPPGAGLPEIYSSEIRIRSELPWNKSLAYKWKRTVYVWTATVLFMSEVGFILCCFRQVLLPRRPSKKKPPRQTPSLTPVKKARNPVKKRVSFQE